jgi:hypothetical protein
MGIYFEETSDVQDSLLLQNKFDSGELHYDQSGLFYDNGHGDLRQSGASARQGDKCIYWVPLDNGNIVLFINGTRQRGILTQNGYHYIQRHLRSSSTLSRN